MKSLIEKQCRASGLRLTRQRRLIGQVISDANAPLDFAELHRRLAERDQRISRATAYSTLRLLTRAGVIESYVLPDGRTRYGGAVGSHHDRLIDMETGKVSNFVDPRIEFLLKEIAEQLGYKLVDH